MNAMKLALLGSLLLLAACGPPRSKYMKRLDQPEVIQADPEMATIVFIRPSDYKLKWRVMVLDSKRNFLGDPWGQTYFAVKVKPGRHTFLTWSNHTPALKAEVEAGKIYYVEVGATYAYGGASANLFALGPDRPNWSSLPGWLKTCTMLRPEVAKGKAHFEKRANRVAEIAWKGTASFTKYGKADVKKRTLLPKDGVDQAVR